MSLKLGLLPIIDMIIWKPDLGGIITAQPCWKQAAHRGELRNRWDCATRYLNIVRVSQYILIVLGGVAVPTVAWEEGWNFDSGWQHAKMFQLWTGRNQCFWFPLKIYIKISGLKFENIFRKIKTQMSKRRGCYTGFPNVKSTWRSWFCRTFQETIRIVESYWLSKSPQTYCKSLLYIWLNKCFIYVIYIYISTHRKTGCHWADGCWFGWVCIEKPSELPHPWPRCVRKCKAFCRNRGKWSPRAMQFGCTVSNVLAILQEHRKYDAVMKLVKDMPELSIYIIIYIYSIHVCIHHERYRYRHRHR